MGSDPFDEAVLLMGDVDPDADFDPVLGFAADAREDVRPEVAGMPDQGVSSRSRIASRCSGCTPEPSRYSRMLP
jgi:hypothetical protein